MSLHLRERCRRYWPALAVLAAGLALSGGIGWELHREALQIDQKRLALRIEEVMDQLDGRVEKTQQLLQSLDDQLAAERTPSAVVFREWWRQRSLGDNFPWLCGLLVATNVEPFANERWNSVPFTRDASSWPAFREFSTNLNVECRVAFTSLFSRSLRFLDDYELRGTRTGTNPANAFSKAAWSRGLRISGQQPIMKDTEGKPVSGILFMMAVHGDNAARVLKGVATDDRARERDVRWIYLQSMIVAPVDFKRLEQAVWDGKESDLGVEIFSSRQISPETWLNPVGSRPKALDPEFRSRVYLTSTNEWKMFLDRFTLVFHTTPLFEAQSPKRLARTVMAAGAGVTVLAALLVAVIGRARLRQQRMAVAVLEARDALAAAEKERVRLGHDLHDGAIQSLYAVQLGLSRTAESVEATLPESARVLDQTRERVDEVIAELRRFILAREAGREEASTPVGLDRVLSAMVERLRPTTTARLEFEAQPGAAGRLSTAQVLQLTQLARSALANCLRHAGARRIDVVLREEAGSVRLEIADDGAGFDPEQPANGGMGLQTMQRRAAEAGGSMTVQSEAGRGTRIVVTLPAGKLDVAPMPGNAQPAGKT